MMNHKTVVLTLAVMMSGSSLYAIAADSTPGTTSTDGTSQTRDPAPKSTNANPDAGSLPKGADGGTTDSGPTPAGSKTGEPGQASGSSSGGNSGGG